MLHARAVACLVGEAGLRVLQPSARAHCQAGSSAGLPEGKEGISSLQEALAGKLSCMQGGGWLTARSSCGCSAWTCLGLDLLLQLESLGKPYGVFLCSSV
jgi:hypothetical protein